MSAAVIDLEMDTTVAVPPPDTELTSTFDVGSNSTLLLTQPTLLEAATATDLDASKKNKKSSLSKSKSLRGGKRLVREGSSAAVGHSLSTSPMKSHKSSSVTRTGSMGGGNDSPVHRIYSVRPAFLKPAKLSRKVLAGVDARSNKKSATRSRSPKQGLKHRGDLPAVVPVMVSVPGDTLGKKRGGSKEACHPVAGSYNCVKTTTDATLHAEQELNLQNLFVNPMKTGEEDTSPAR